MLWNKHYLAVDVIADFHFFAYRAYWSPTFFKIAFFLCITNRARARGSTIAIYWIVRLIPWNTVKQERVKSERLKKLPSLQSCKYFRSCAIGLYGHMNTLQLKLRNMSDIPQFSERRSLGKNPWRIMSAIASIWRKNMLWYIFLDVIYPEKLKLWTSRNRWRLRTNVYRQQVVPRESCFHGWNKMIINEKKLESVSFMFSTLLSQFNVLRWTKPCPRPANKFLSARPYFSKDKDGSPGTVPSFVSAHMFYASRKAWFTATSALWPWRN